MTISRNVLLVSTRLRRSTSTWYIITLYQYSLWEIFPSCECVRNRKIYGISCTPQTDYITKSEKYDGNGVCPFRSLRTVGQSSDKQVQGDGRTCGRLPSEHTTTTNSKAIYSCRFHQGSLASWLSDGKVHWLTLRTTSKTLLPAPWLRKLNASVFVLAVAEETNYQINGCYKQCSTYLQKENSRRRKPDKNWREKST